MEIRFPSSIRRHQRIGRAGLMLAIATATSFLWADGAIVRPPRVQPLNGFSSVREHGAAGDGVAMDTRAIQAAIDACGTAGGGTVYFPPGTYLSGALQLRSHVTLYLEGGAELRGSQDPRDYPLVPSWWAPYLDPADGNTSVARHQERLISSLLNAVDVVNVTIGGRGVIDGQGAPWWRLRGMSVEYARKGVTAAPAGQEAEFAAMKQVERHGRPSLLRMVRCRDVLLENLTLTNSPAWTVHFLFCDGVAVRGVTIRNPADSYNTDGINPESSRNVRISDCHIATGDDAIAIKSGRDAPGRRAGIPSENITITGCTIDNSHGISIGSEMSGSVRNVTVSNCVIRNSSHGLRIKTQRGRGGVVEGVTMSNLVLENIRFGLVMDMYYQRVSPRAPLHVDPDAGAMAVTGETPAFRNVSLNAILARNVEVAGIFRGLPEMPIHGVTLANIRMTAGEGFRAARLAEFTMRNVSLTVQTGPALQCEDVAGLDIDGLTAVAGPDSSAVIQAKNVTDAFIRNGRAAPKTAAFLAVEGAGTRRVLLRGSFLPDGMVPVQRAVEVPADSVKVD